MAGVAKFAKRCRKYHDKNLAFQTTKEEFEEKIIFLTKSV
jgi:hypothetical protein